MQSERSYLRSKVPDGVSHLFPCTAGALFPEANSLLLPPHHTYAPLYVTRVLTHARLRGCRGSHTSWGMCPGGKPPVYSMPPRHPAGLSSCRGMSRGEFPSVTPAGRSSPWAQPILHYEHKRVLHSARKSGLHDEQREFFSTPKSIPRQRALSFPNPAHAGCHSNSECVDASGHRCGNHSNP